MLREHNIPDLKYLGQREYTDEYESHPEFHGQMMHWYRLENQGDPIEIPVCDFIQVDAVEEDDYKENTKQRELLLCLLDSGNGSIYSTTGVYSIWYYEDNRLP